jgi:hypothetical protein
VDFSKVRGDEPLDPEALTVDLPTTARDVRALRAARARLRLADLADWNWLSAGWQFEAPQRRTTAEGREPFEL